MILNDDAGSRCQTLAYALDAGFTGLRVSHLAWPDLYRVEKFSMLVRQLVREGEQRR